jgi:RHS repeat-associated protein
VTKLAWDSDNNVTSLTEDNGAQSTWTYDPNTGYPLTKHDAQANHDGTAGTTYTYQTSLSGHVADLISELTPQQRLWTFGYDTNGNLTSVTKPLGNVSGATAGSYTSKYTKYDSFGDLLTSVDPNGNATTYGSYDPSGYPGTITIPTGNPASPVYETTAYTYDADGNVTAVKDPLGNTTTQAYDVFGRTGKKVVPVDATRSDTTQAPVYDGNDNVTTSYAPSFSSTSPGPATTAAFNADDELSSKVTPPDTSSSPPPTTTYTYDNNGNLATQTAPDGNVPGATAGSYTTSYGYDAINEQTSVTDPLGNETRYGYDDVGNRNSVATARQFAAEVSTQTQYNLNNQVTQVTDPAGNFAKTGYDLDGNVTSTTDQNNNTTQYTLDADGQVTQVQAPAQAPGASVTYNTTQYTYDQNGNKTQVISPRGVASGITNAYTTQTKYTADNQVSAVLAPYLPGDVNYGTPAETDYSYDAAGRLLSVSAPPSGTSTTRNVTGYGYFDNGWTQASTDPTGLTTGYDYNALGEQASRTLQSAGGDLTRTMTSGYYPDGKQSSLLDQGVPTGLYAEVTQANDANASPAPAGSWTKTPCGTTAGCEGPEYYTHAAGTGTDSFSWHLYVPADGSYTVYVKYPVVSGAATSASYTVNYHGGTATATADQTQNNSNGWVSLGKWAFTQTDQNQQVTLKENSGGIVVADAVKIVSDTTGITNTSNHSYTYKYDANGNQTEIDDASPGAAVTSTVTGYDQDNRNTSVTEQHTDPTTGTVTTVHTTSYGYDADSNLASQTHDAAPLSNSTYGTYTYNNLNQLSQESDATSATDPSPQVTSFIYNPTGQVATETKPNQNKVTSTYYANGLLYQQTEDTSGGTLVSSHQYSYDPNGNQMQDVQKLMSADDPSGGTDLSHTLGYTYDPMNQVATVTTDGTPTETYTHDANNNVTSQSITDTSTGTATTTNYGYDQGRLVTAGVVGAGTSNYNYDPFGRLDTVTSVLPGSTTPTTLQSNTYDGFDNLASTTQMTSSGSMATTSYTYDSLNRMASQTTNAGTSTAGTSNFSYLGLSSQLASEQDPASGTSPSQTKTYDYTPGGMRLSQTTTPSGGTGTPGYYSYNSHSDVQALTGSNGNTTSTYGYTAYGDPVTSMYTGKDKSSATSSPTSTTQPYSAYRYNAMRWDSTTGQYDMGFRTYNPGLNQFVSRDMYNGALSDAGLTTDPFTGSRYAFGNGNPVTNIELDGHMPCIPGGPCGSFQALERWSASQPSTTTSTKPKSDTGETPALWETLHKYLEAGLAPFDIVAADHWIGALEKMAGQPSEWVKQLGENIDAYERGAATMASESRVQQLISLAGEADRVGAKIDAWTAFSPKWLQAAAGKLAALRGTGYVLSGLGLAADVGTIISPGDKGAAGWVDRGAAGINGALITANLVTDEIPVVGEATMIGTGVYLAGDYLYNHWTPFHNVVNNVGSGLSDAWHSTTSFLGGLF